MNNNILSRNLKAFRLKSGLTQVEIADLVGITDKNWSSYERGKTEPNIETLLKIASAFGVSVDSLISKDVSLIAKKLVDKNRENITLKEALNIVNEEDPDYSSDRVKQVDDVVVIPLDSLKKLYKRVTTIEARLNQLETNKGNQRVKK